MTDFTPWPQDRARPCRRKGHRIGRVPLRGEDDPGPGPTPPGAVAFFQPSDGSTGTPKLIPRSHDKARVLTAVGRTDKRRLRPPLDLELAKERRCL